MLKAYAIHFDDFDPKSVRFKVAEAGTVVVVRYEPEGRNDGDREQVKEYIMKEYGCTARKDGTANEKAHDYTFLNPEEKKAGFLVFDFPVHKEAYRCQEELDGKKALDKIALRVENLAARGLQFFDYCRLDNKNKDRDDWIVCGRGDNKNFEFHCDVPQVKD